MCKISRDERPGTYDRAPATDTKISPYEPERRRTEVSESVAGTVSLERVSPSYGIFYISISSVFEIVFAFLMQKDIAKFAQSLP